MRIYYHNLDLQELGKVSIDIHVIILIYFSQKYVMEPYINVEPCDLIQVMTKIKIKVLSLELNQFATIQVMCYDDANNFLHCYVFELRDEYQFWNNDEWLINYVMNRYGFIIKNNIGI